VCAANAEPLNKQQAAVLAVLNPVWTKPEFQRNPLAGEGFALLGNGNSELKFLFLFSGLAEKCFSRNSLIPLSLRAGRSGRHWREAAGTLLGGEPGVGDSEEVQEDEEGAGRGQGCSEGEVPEPGTFLGGLWLAGAAWGAALILAGAAPEDLAGFRVTTCVLLPLTVASPLSLFSLLPFLLEISSRYARIRQRFHPYDQRHHN